MEALHRGENIGGIAVVEICHVKDLLNSNPVVFAPLKTWCKIEVVPMSAELKDQEEDTDHGMLYTYTGKFVRHYPHKRDEEKFAQYIGKHSLLRITDLNGDVRVLGSIENPVTITRSGSRGRVPTDMAHNEFEFSVIQSNRAL